MNENQGRSRAKKGIFPLSILGRTALLLIIILLLFLIFLCFKQIKISETENMIKDDRIENLEAQIKIEENKKEDIIKSKENRDTDENIEEIARSEGLIKKDEIVIKPR